MQNFSCSAIIRTNSEKAQKGNVQKPSENKLAQSTKIPKFPCAFCKEMDHFPDQCKKLKTAEERKAILHENKHCLKCLRKNHTSENCLKPAKNCFFCKSDHPTSLCEEKFRKISENSEANDIRKISENSEAEAEKENFEANTKNIETKNVLLACEVNVFNPICPEKQIKATIGIDCMSTHSYFTKKLAEKLGLKPVDNEIHYIQPFPETKSPEIECEVNLYQIGLQTVPTEKLIIEVGQIKNQKTLIKIPIIDAQANEKTFESAEIPNKAVEIDVLLGIDYFFELDLRRRQKLISGFWIADSILGPMIGGKGRSISEQNPKKLVKKSEKNTRQNTKSEKPKMKSKKAKNAKTNKKKTWQTQFAGQPSMASPVMCPEVVDMPGSASSFSRGSVQSAAGKRIDVPSSKARPKSRHK